MALPVHVWSLPVEISSPIRFEDDTESDEQLEQGEAGERQPGQQQQQQPAQQPGQQQEQQAGQAPQPDEGSDR